jgi:hypothetical protein
MGKNTTPEAYDEQPIDSEAPLSQEDILMNESDILSGLLDLSKSKDEAANYRTIQIKRNGVLKLSFRVRPLTEDESQACMRAATKYAPTKPGQPKRAIETDNSQFRARLIYAATINEDRAKIWDNKKAQEATGVVQGIDMIEKLLLAGEKSRIIEVIDQLSGYDETEETAGN